jgi:hypothetical protein
MNGVRGSWNGGSGNSTLCGLAADEIFAFFVHYARVNTVNPALQSFLSVALPIMVTLVATIWLASWSQNKRFDDLNRRFDDFSLRFNKRLDDLRTEMNARFADVIARLDRIELKLDNHEARIVRLEERTSIIR